MKYRYIGVNKIRQIDETNRVAQLYDPNELTKLLNGAQNIKVNEKYSIFQLGWSSICEFKVVNNQFGIKALHDKKSGSDFPNSFVDCIATRAVASCTFIHLTDGVEHLTAHLDSSDIDDMEKLIFSFCDDHKIKPLIMTCSVMDDVKEKDFVTRLSTMCSKVILFDRGKLDVMKPSLKSHLEIGFYIDKDSCELFGDVCMYGQKECEISLFSNVDEFIKIGAKVIK